MASTLITVAQVRQHATFDRDDESLERLIDAADADIVREYGPHDGEQALAMRPSFSGAMRIYFPRPASAVASVIDVDGNKTVEASTYDLGNGGRVLFRSAGWDSRYIVTWTPVPDNARRILVLVDLVRLDDTTVGLEARSIGEQREQYLERDTERRRILSRLRQNYAGGGLLV